MRRLLIALAAASMLPAPVLAKPAPVEVTRFHTAETLERLKGAAVIVQSAPGEDPASLEGQAWRTAVERELAAAGFGSAAAGAADGIAEVRVERQTILPERKRSPVSVGVGGSTGSYGGGVGLGIGFSLGGGPKEMIVTRLSVMIRDRLTGQSLWEGRAETTEKAKAKAAAPSETAPRLAHALFAGFPGTSGATITVK